MDLLLYSHAIFVNWFSGVRWLTAVPVAASYFMPPTWFAGAQQWIDQRLKADARRKLYVFLAIVGLFWASFYAWDEQYQLATSKSSEALTAQITSLQNEIASLRIYKEQHEAGEWPALNAHQQQEWVAALSKYSGQLRAIQLIDVDSRGELLVDSLLKVFRAAHLPEPTIGTDGTGLTNGLRIAGQPKEVGDTAKQLFEKLGYKVPPAAEIGASQPMLQITIGRRDP
jgi:hypothetical protein